MDAYTDDTTLEDEWEIQRMNALEPTEQRLVALHMADQFEAVPSYVENQAADFASEEA